MSLPRRGFCRRSAAPARVGLMGAQSLIAPTAAAFRPFAEPASRRSCSAACSDGLLHTLQAELESIVLYVQRVLLESPPCIDA